MITKRKGYVAVESLQRWREVWPSLHPLVQAAYAELNELYQSDYVEFDNDLRTFTKFNLRYKNHPDTNLAEASQASSLLYENMLDRVCVLTDEDKQLRGCDVCGWLGDTEVSISNKLALVYDDGAHISSDVRNTILAERHTTFTALCSNYNNRWVLISRSELQQYLKQPSVKSKSGKFIIWYDKLNDRYLDPMPLITIYGDHT